MWLNMWLNIMCLDMWLNMWLNIMWLNIMWLNMWLNIMWLDMWNVCCYGLLLEMFYYRLC